MLGIKNFFDPYLHSEKTKSRSFDILRSDQGFESGPTLIDLVINNYVQIYLVVTGVVGLAVVFVVVELEVVEVTVVVDVAVVVLVLVDDELGVGGVVVPGVKVVVVVTFSGVKLVSDLGV